MIKLIIVFFGLGIGALNAIAEVPIFVPNSKEEAYLLFSRESEKDGKKIITETYDVSLPVGERRVMFYAKKDEDLARDKETIENFNAGKISYKEADLLINQKTDLIANRICQAYGFDSQDSNRNTELSIDFLQSWAVDFKTVKVLTIDENLKFNEVPVNFVQNDDIEKLAEKMGKTPQYLADIRPTIDQIQVIDKLSCLKSYTKN